jgi:hypothetical protein
LHFQNFLPPFICIFEMKKSSGASRNAAARASGFRPSSFLLFQLSNDHVCVFLIPHLHLNVRAFHVRVFGSFAVAVAKRQRAEPEAEADAANVANVALTSQMSPRSSASAASVR